MGQSKLTNGKYLSLRPVVGVRLSSFLLIFLFLGCSCSEKSILPPEKINSIKHFEIDKTQLRSDLVEFTKTEHPFGSPRQRELSNWILSRSKENGLDPYIDSFTSNTPNLTISLNPNAPAELQLEKDGFNVIAKLNGDKDCNILLGSHYDTKKIFNSSYLGANDSASSSAALFQIDKIINANSSESDRCDITFIWFDGEESVLPKWNDGELKYPKKIIDNTYGSRELAAKLSKCESNYCMPKSSKPIQALILLDMIGSKNLQITIDTNSSPTLLSLMNDSASKLNLSSSIGSRSQRIEDDHIPFKKLGIPVLNIIDFNNIYTWHTSNDTLETVSLESIESASKIAALITLRLSQKYKN